MLERNVIDALKRGDVGIIPTDTLYGIVAGVWKRESVERVYAIRSRDKNKACIILVADIDTLEQFSIALTSKEKSWLEGIWPGKVSVILPSPDETFSYLTRGTGHLAFRIPNDESLRALLREAGPLIAPSANPQGETPAETIAEAKRYFGDQVDFYIDGGTLQGEPSTIVQLENNRVTIVRLGAVRIEETTL